MNAVSLECTPRVQDGRFLHRNDFGKVDRKTGRRADPLQAIVIEAEAMCTSGGYNCRRSGGARHRD